MFCTSCGKELPDNARFCGSCGASLNPSVQQSTSADQSAPPIQTPPPQPTQPPKPSVDVKAEISKLQGKLDNSNSSFLKGRSIWDVIGLCAVALMVLGFFLPFETFAAKGIGAGDISLAKIVSLSEDIPPLAFFFIYLAPAVCCVFDLIVTKENSTRHPRLIIMGIFGLCFEVLIDAIGEKCADLSSFVNSLGITSTKASLGIGFYLILIASVVIIIVGIIGIVEKKKGKIAG